MWNIGQQLDAAYNNLAEQLQDSGGDKANDEKDTGIDKNNGNHNRMPVNGAGLDYTYSVELGVKK